MYLQHYGLSEKPFTITPNPRFVFLSRQHREVFAHLLYGIHAAAGFIEVTGEVGTGKTTVLRSLFAELEKEQTRIAYIFNPCLSAQELLQAINREFGLADRDSAADLHADLNRFLLAEKRAERKVVLVIDEAQNLAPAVLEQVRLLSNLETETDKLIQIILVGQPELGEILGRPELRQLAQRITVRYQLKAMDEEDTAAYIVHRLGVAGRRTPLFTPEAIRLVYRISRGNPRLINILCDRALLAGYAAGSERIEPAQVRTARNELRRERPGRYDLRAFLWLAALLPLLLVAIWYVSPRQAMAPLKDSAPPATLPVASPLPESYFLFDAPTELARVNRLLSLWGGQPVSGSGTIEELLKKSRSQNFEVARIRGESTALQQLGLPLLLELNRNGRLSYLPVAAIDATGVQVVEEEGMRRLDWDLFAPFWSGRAYFLWRNPLHLPVNQSRFSADEFRRLKRLLSAAGEPLSDRETAADAGRLLKEFQLRHNLPADGVSGVQTLIFLYRLAGMVPVSAVTPSEVL